jgi:hypothetical protein
LQLAVYCDKVLRLSEANGHIAAQERTAFIMTECVLKSMTLGDKKAGSLYPRLLQLLVLYPGIPFEEYVSESQARGLTPFAKAFPSTSEIIIIHVLS